MSEYIIDEYDPFHPQYCLEFDGSEQLIDEPMEDYNWEEWLDNWYEVNYEDLV
jgi:hypothetical protein